MRLVASFGSGPRERLEGPQRRDGARVARSAHPSMLRQGEVEAETYQRPPDPLADCPRGEQSRLAQLAATSRRRCWSS